jgi:hypothetical protein
VGQLIAMSNGGIKNFDVCNMMDRRAIVSGNVMTLLGHASGNWIDIKRVTDLLK